MKTTERFEKAVSKLYNAFHQNRLNAYNCSACAVGNICGGNEWVETEVMYSRDLVSLEGIKNFVDTPNILNTNYSALELAQVENLFMFGSRLEYGCKDIFTSSDKKERQFQGLCSVVEYLSELDNIPNPMDYSKLFETENESAKYQLTEIF
jgi:hypothetical protein